MTEYCKHNLGAMRAFYLGGLRVCGSEDGRGVGGGMGSMRIARMSGKFALGDSVTAMGYGGGRAERAAFGFTVNVKNKRRY